jgi:hypothetical protein
MSTDDIREVVKLTALLFVRYNYHGGILHHNFRTRRIPKLDNLRFKNRMKEKLGEVEYRQRVQVALSDPEVAAIPTPVGALRDPDKGRNAWIVEPLPFPSVASALARDTGQPHRAFIPGGNITT